MDKPFIFGVAAAGDNFTDRKNESLRLEANFTHGVNTIIISPRRWGKTSLVRKVSQSIHEKDIRMVYLDIFSCRSEYDFYKAFTTAVLKQTSSRLDEWIENAKTFLSHITPKISIGTDPTSDFSLSFEWNPKDDSADEILQLPERIAEKKNIRVVICIDEFQQIAEFDDSKSFQKKLRTIWQLQKLTSYCLFGSKKHLMNELFEKKSLPFYKFGDVMYLPKIGKPDWIEYICKQFRQTGKEISAEQAGQICDLTENHSSYVQQLSWLVWLHTEQTVNAQSIDEAVEDLLAQNSILYQRETENLSSYQMNFLRAMVDGVDSEFSRKEVIDTYRLGSSANVQRIKKALAQRELIDIEGRKVVLNDPVFKLWLEREIR